MHKSLFGLVLLFNSLCLYAEESRLVGFWKSDEVKTLKSMNETIEVTDQARKIFSNGFFGQLIIEYRESDFRSKFTNPEEHHEILDEYIEYKILDETEEYFLIESFDSLLGEINSKKLYKEGNCYYILVSKWRFKEYFCKFKNEI